MIRKAKAVWRGTGRDGKGTLSTDSGVIAETPWAAFKAKQEREARKGKELVDPLAAGATLDPETPKPAPRQQPKKQTREQRKKQRPQKADGQKPDDPGSDGGADPDDA